MPAACQVDEMIHETDAGPAISVRQLFDEHGRFVSRTLLCLGVPRSDAEDALQEVFLVVHRRLPEYESRGSVRSWLYAICVWVAASHRRKLARRRERPTDAPPESVVPPSQERRADQRLQRGLAMSALSGLKDQQRQVFVLYEVEELSMPEVADSLDIPLQTAYSRLYAARKSLVAAVRRARNRRAP